MEGFFMAQMMWFGGTFAPLNWIDCSGSLLQINDYSALYALIGTTYGGDGQFTFGLPDMRGRIPVGAGQGPGLPNVVLAEMSGSENKTLLIQNLPSHTHTVTNAQIKASSNSPTVNSPIGNVFAATSSPFYDGATGATPGLRGVTGSTGITGGNIPINVHMPGLGLRCLICVEGIFPSRS